jgi:hypothetical protein
MKRLGFFGNSYCPNHSEIFDEQTLAGMETGGMREGVVMRYLMILYDCSAICLAGVCMPQCVSQVVHFLRTAPKRPCVVEAGVSCDLNMLECTDTLKSARY